MELFNFIFRLGVVFAIFGFLFGIIEIGLSLLHAGRPKTLAEEYFVKAVKYLILVDVTFLFAADLTGDQLPQNNLILSVLILLTYFIGRLQSKKQQQAMFKLMGNGIFNVTGNFNIKLETAVISAAIGLFVFFIFYPELASNRASVWFHDSIMNIEDTPVFGFIFKVIGFFFLITMILRMVNGFMFLISGKPFMQVSSGFRKTKKKKKDDEFDDYEELK